MHTQIPEQNGKGAHNRLSSAEPKAETGMEITALGGNGGTFRKCGPRKKEKQK